MVVRDPVSACGRDQDKAFLAFDPLAPKLPEARVIDLECDPADELLPRYGTVVQSIRMVSCKGRNVKVCAIDEVWSGLKLVVRKELR